METATHILIVDDDSDIRTILSRFLDKEGYRTTTAANAEEMRQQIKQDTPQLIILDLILPGEDGFTLAKEVRSSLDVGIIMVTGKQDTVDKIVGLEMGADDYITKPFDDRELLARVRSVLRRTSKSPASNTSSPGLVANFAGWKLDLTAHELHSPAGEEVRLTSYESFLITYFCHNSLANFLACSSSPGLICTPMTSRGFCAGLNPLAAATPNHA